LWGQTDGRTDGTTNQPTKSLIEALLCQSPNLPIREQRTFLEKIL
jgi:hypothetical protein